MSGIVGIFHRDGAPVDPDVLDTMTRSMQRRGPDAQHTWIDGHIGFGHAALFTTLEAERENQPSTLDGQVWITADARIDAREELRRLLEAKEQHVRDDVTDVELILHAYHVWGENCVDHLIGDFAFAIWDAPQQKLFCARDHMGVKHFYYYLTDRLFVFASEVGALLTMPEVPRRINEARIADYLAGYLEGVDWTSSFYQHIHQVPRAQCRVIDREQYSDRTYWTLDPSREVRFRSNHEYAQAFLEVFTEAVRCRLRTPGRVGSMLSGGLDSSSIVGVAGGLLRDGGHEPLQTFSAVSIDENDVETQIIKAALKMDHLHPHLLRSDALDDLAEDYDSLYQAHHDPFDTTMPIPQAMYILARRQGLKAVLDGVPGDNVTSLGDHYLTFLIRKGQWATAISEAFGQSRLYHRWKLSPWKLLFSRAKAAAAPAWWRSLRIRTTQKKRLEQTRQAAFINQAFAERVDLAGRIEKYTNHPHTPRTIREDHVRRLDYRYLVGVERYGRVAAHYGIEPRHPYLDKRVLEFCLGLDWMQKDYRGWSKVVNRRAMAGILPDDVRWSTPRPSVAPEFWRARSEAIRAHRDDLAGEAFLDHLAPFIEVTKAREAFNGPAEALKDSNLDIWTLHALHGWLRRWQEEESCYNER